MLKIGISACFFHGDRERPIFKGMTLQYIEQNVAHWLMQRDVLAFMVPSPEGSTRRAGSRTTVAAYAEELDGLVLMGGSDVCPESYGEKAIKPEWNGDRIRDDYEIALLRAFMALRKPVLGVCRGAQVINVAQGGTLYQDLATQAPHALNHRNWAIYAENCHATSFVPGSALARLYPGLTVVKTNSIHHQAVKELGRDLVVEAYSEPDRIVEALGTPVRATCSPCNGTRSFTHPTIPRSSTTRRSSTISSPPPRSTRTRRLPYEQEYGARMKITNPATGAVIADVAADNAAAVRRKYEVARAGAARWTRVPLRKRLETIAKLRERIVAMHETLARTLTKEVGKPIRQSRNELNGLLARLDFFVGPNPRASCATRRFSRTPRRSWRSGSRTSRSAWSPTFRRGTIRISLAATYSFRRWWPAMQSSTSRRSTRR